MSQNTRSAPPAPWRYDQLCAVGTSGAVQTQKSPAPGPALGRRWALSVPRPVLGVHRDACDALSFSPALLHEAVLRCAGEGFAVLVDGLGRARIALAFVKEAGLGRADQRVAVLIDGSAFACALRHRCAEQREPDDYHRT